MYVLKVVNCIFFQCMFLNMFLYLKFHEFLKMHDLNKRYLYYYYY